MCSTHCQKKYSLYRCIAIRCFLEAQRNSNPLFPANCFLDRVHLRLFSGEGSRTHSAFVFDRHRGGNESMLHLQTVSGLKNWLCTPVSIVSFIPAVGYITIYHLMSMVNNVDIRILLVTSCHVFWLWVEKNCRPQIASVPFISLIEEPRALAFHARDDALAPLETTPEALLRGWRERTQFFFSCSILVMLHVRFCINLELSLATANFG